MRAAATAAAAAAADSVATLHFSSIASVVECITLAISLSSRRVSDFELPLVRARDILVLPSVMSMRHVNGFKLVTDVEDVEISRGKACKYE